MSLYPSFARPRSLQQAAELLAARVEGNLLAAAQELEKMGLAGMEGEVTWEDIVSLGEDTSRYNTFDLLDAVMTARPERVARMIGALREEGTTLFAILGALNSQVRSMQDGPPKWMPRQRIRMLEEFQRRVRQPAAVISEMGVIEQQAKGQLPGDAWMALERLLLRLAGVRQISLPGEDQKILML